MSTLKIRPAVSAGMRGFYPSDPARLDAVIGEFMDKVQPPADIEPIALICPHAGYVYSGQTAAHAYRLLQGRKYDRVVVLAPSHYAMFRGGSIFDGTAFATPLGDIPLDRPFIQRLTTLAPIFLYNPEAEAREHSLEVQLPFLKRMLGDFRLVPVVIYDRGFDNCRAIGQAVAAAIREDGARTLIVASSDLYHGPNPVVARRKSETAADAIAQCDPESFCRGIEQNDYQACGSGPIVAAMVAARELGATKSTILHITTSYEVCPMNDDYVVGYLAAALH